MACEIKIEKLRLKTKNEVDLRVECLKNEIDILGNHLFDDIDKMCDDALK